MAVKHASTDVELELAWRTDLMRRLADIESGRVSIASDETVGLIRLAGDLAGTPENPTVPGLLEKADESGVAHNHGDETWTGIKNFYVSPLVPTPSASGQAANKAYVDAVGGGGGAPDATSLVKGILRLTGDLGGTATSPTVPGLAAKAVDSAVAHNTGAETWAGIKTFSSSPIAPTPTTATQVAIKSYVDGLDALAAHLAGTETFTGTKTFNANITVPATPTASGHATSKSYTDTADALKADDSAVVKLTGAQTVAGVKTFSSLPSIPATPVATTDATSKSYVDGLVAAGAPDASTTTKGILKLAGDLAGTALLPTVPGLTAKATDSAVVHNTGAETVAGVKTFSSPPIVPTPVGTTDAINKVYVDQLCLGKYKAADTVRTSTAALASDPDLTVSVLASSVYVVDITILFSSNTTPNFKNAMVQPAGATGRLANYSSVNGYRLSDATVDTWTVANTTVRAIRYSGTLVTTSAGTYAFQWAQNVSNVANTTVHQGSCMILHKIA